VLTRRQFLRTAAGATALTALRPERAFAALAEGAPAALPSPAAAPFDHVVLLMLENRSFDHMLGWLPGADGRQGGLSYADTKGTVYPTYPLAPDFQGCGYADPDHSWEGGVKQLDGGKCDGFLKTAAPGDTFPIGYYTAADLPVLAALATNYTTFPNRFYQHAATTDRDHNMGVTQSVITKTIWTRLEAAGVSKAYYFIDEPFIGLFGAAHLTYGRPYAQFLADAAAGTLPAVSFVDPSFAGEGQGTSGDQHPHGDMRTGEALIAEIYHALRIGPQWSKTVFVVNYDEWGGFYDHVPPPRVIDDTKPGPTFLSPAPHPDYSQLGFRVPCVVASPFAPKKIVSGGAPFEHTSVLKMIEWRWGLQPLTARDANARNLAEALDLTGPPRTDSPVIPGPPAQASIACGPTSVAAKPPQPLAPAGPGGATGGATGGPSASGVSGTTAATGGRSTVAVAAGAAAIGAGLAARRVKAKAEGT
jgi:phospholipase C